MTNDIWMIMVTDWTPRYGKRKRERSKVKQNVKR